MLERIRQGQYFHNRKKLGIVAIIFMLLVIAWAFTGESIAIGLPDYETTYWTEGWTQVVDGEAIILEDISDFQEIPVGDTLVLINEVPELTSEMILFFYTKDLEVNVYAGEELLYSFEMQEQFEFLETPGNKWNQVEIPVELSGETLRIEFTSQFANRYISTVTALALIKDYEASAIILQQDSYRLIMSIVVLGMTISAYVDACIWQRKKIKKYFIALGTFCLSATLWLFSMSGLFNYMWNSPIVSYLISLLMVSVIPVTLYEFIDTIYDGKSKLCKILGVIVWADFFIQFILQFVFHVSFLTLLPLTYFVFTVGSLGVFYMIIQYLIEYKKNKDSHKQLNFELASTLIIFVGALVEIVVLCVAPERTDLIGVAGIFGLFIYLIVNQTALTMFESKTDMEKIIIEESYYALQNTTLIQQIKAHFFFNTLNTISALCKQDPGEADRAIKLFAKYMRSYMYLINEHANIPIEQELELVKSSLEIECLRFQDTFEYSIDLQCKDFLIPPLSLQPLVENAMLHGLRKTNRYGILRISTLEKNQRIQVKVEDNGAGFDTAILDISESVGLKNMKKRVEIMANGTVNIKSEIGKGTVVTIEIPIRKE